MKIFRIFQDSNPSDFNIKELLAEVDLTPYEIDVLMHLPVGQLFEVEEDLSIIRVV